MDALIARLAARQHGLVTFAQMLAAGLDRKAIARRVQAGRLHRVARGVYAVGHVALSREGTFLAAVLEAGKGAALAHLAAAELWRRVRTGPLVLMAMNARGRNATTSASKRYSRRPATR